MVDQGQVWLHFTLHQDWQPTVTPPHHICLLCITKPSSFGTSTLPHHQAGQPSEKYGAQSISKMCRHKQAPLKAVHTTEVAQMILHLYYRFNVGVAENTAAPHVFRLGISFVLKARHLWWPKVAFKILSKPCWRLQNCNDPTSFSLLLNEPHQIHGCWGVEALGVLYASPSKIVITSSQMLSLRSWTPVSCPLVTWRGKTLPAL